MPTPTENIFSLLDQMDYAGIMTLIKADKSLINAVSSENSQSLLQSLLYEGTAEAGPLIKYILTQPEFDFKYFNEEYENTNLDDLITFICLDEFKSIIENPAILFNRDKLTFQSAKEQLISVEASLAQAMRVNPNSSSAQIYKNKASKLKEIIAYLREATILHAIEKDDASLFDSLAQIGFDPSDTLDKLGNGKSPRQLITAQKTPNLDIWFKRLREKIIARSASNPHSFHNISKENTRIEGEIAKLKEERTKAVAGAHLRFLTTEIDITKQVAATITPVNKKTK